MGCCSSKIPLVRPYHPQGDHLEANHEYVVTIQRAVDGDTYEVIYERISIIVRLNGIQCPETKLYQGVTPDEKALGIKVKNHVEHMFASKKAMLVIGPKLFDKYKRISGHLRVDGEGKKVDITSYLLGRGYGLPYDGKGPKPSFHGVRMVFDEDSA